MGTLKMIDPSDVQEFYYFNARIYTKANSPKYLVIQVQQTDGLLKIKAFVILCQLRI